MNFRPVYRVTVFSPLRCASEILALIREFSMETSIGPYNSVYWHDAGTGVESFVPTRDANPTLGTYNALSESPSMRIEFSVARNQDVIERLVGGIVRLHAWEQPVIHISEEMQYISSSS